MLYTGIVLLACSFAVHIFLDESILSHQKMMAEQAGNLPPEFIRITQDTFWSNVKLQKILEFLSIPLSISLIVAAFLNKAESKFQTEIGRYRDGYDALQQLELKLEKVNDELQVMLNNNVSAQAINDTTEEIDGLKRELYYLHRELIADFSHLINADVVKRPERRRH